MPTPVFNLITSGSAVWSQTEAAPCLAPLKKSHISVAGDQLDVAVDSVAVSGNVRIIDIVPNQRNTIGEVLA